MSPADWATTATGAISVIAAAGITIRWTIKHYLSELKPNSGSSLRDAVDNISKDVTELRVSVARLEGQFTQHVTEDKP
jgi:hypothetical protein